MLVGHALFLKTTHGQDLWVCIQFGLGLGTQAVQIIGVNFVQFRLIGEVGYDFQSK